MPGQLFPPQTHQSLKEHPEKRELNFLERLCNLLKQLHTVVSFGFFYIKQVVNREERSLIVETFNSYDKKTTKNLHAADVLC